MPVRNLSGRPDIIEHMFDTIEQSNTPTELVRWPEDPPADADAANATVFADDMFADELSDGWGDDDWLADSVAQIAERVPSLNTAVALSEIDETALSADERVAYLQAYARLLAHIQSQVHYATSLVHQASVDLFDNSEDAYTNTQAELRWALRLSRMGATHQLDTALSLQEFPTLLRALLDGHLDRVRLNAIVASIGHLDHDTAQTVIDDLGPDLESLSAAQLRRRIKQAAIGLNPTDADDRNRTALADRSVRLTATDDSTAHLSGYDLPADQATEAVNRINQIARTLKTDGETRTMDQLRADVYLGLLRGDPTLDQAARGVINVHVELQTLLGLSNRPAIIERYGPVVAGIARHLTLTQTNRYEYTVSHHGQPIAVGTTRPPDVAKTATVSPTVSSTATCPTTKPDGVVAMATGSTAGAITITRLVDQPPLAHHGRNANTHQRRTIQAAHPHCLFAHCGRAATECDIDHTKPWAKGGPTANGNLKPLCRPDHRIKDLGWTYTVNPDGTTTWKSPLGTTYQHRPQPRFPTPP